MKRIKSLDDLKKLSKNAKNKFDLREKANDPDKVVQIKVAMATCGIASGAKETMDFLIEELDRQSIKAIVTQTGCMGYCYAEPTIEVTMPNNDPIVFGYVDTKKAKEIVEKYIKKNELVDGILPVNYETIDKQ
ncbi:MAG: (2Fe-2S) ferredoxin domain-containing protein [Bacteroidales bacterium]|nr:(2Fe-2S) ferredoxin domain-containing protein [Bacteroidales bacterium]